MKKSNDFDPDNFAFDEYGELIYVKGRRDRGPHRRADGLRDYDYGALIADPYGVQRIIMREVNMNEHSSADWSADHDRCLMWDYEGFRALLMEFVGSGELALGQWAHETSEPKLLEFGNRLADLYRGNTPAKQYDGVRVVRGTNVSNGYPVYTIQLKEKR